MPTIGVHRGVGLHAFQSEERIERTVRPQLDMVLETADPEALLRMAGDQSLAPEARLLAEARYRAAYELVADDHRHTRAAFRLELAAAFTAGLDSLTWASLTHYGSALDVPAAPGDDRPGPEPRPLEQQELLRAAQDNSANLRSNLQAWR
jgi:hypothetical protein